MPISFLGSSTAVQAFEVARGLFSNSRLASSPEADVIAILNRVHSHMVRFSFHLLKFSKCFLGRLVCRNHEPRQQTIRTRISTSHVVVQCRAASVSE